VITVVETSNAIGAAYKPVLERFFLYIYRKEGGHMYTEKVLFTECFVLVTSIFGDKTPETFVPHGL
jgi:hypothetical protein